MTAPLFVVWYLVFAVTLSYYSDCFFFFFQAEDGIRDLVRSRGLGDVYKRQVFHGRVGRRKKVFQGFLKRLNAARGIEKDREGEGCLLYTSDAADERSSVDLGGRRIIKKKKTGKIV